MLEMIFGPDCGLLGPIDRVLRVLLHPLHFASFAEGDFKSLLWASIAPLGVFSLMGIPGGWSA
jgi:hypothetical protein